MELNFLNEQRKSHCEFKSGRKLIIPSLKYYDPTLKYDNSSQFEIDVCLNRKESKKKIKKKIMEIIRRIKR